MRAKDEAWAAPEIPFSFPVVAKSAKGEPYDVLEFEGKRKIWFIDTPEELTQLWEMLKDAGFRDTFLVQELIPGDNTAMRSITAYVDSRGKVTLIGSARVLLEDHAPTMIGNPVAMITEDFPQLWADACTLLTENGYRGFANFDVKIDPRDGRALFFELNPRIGRAGCAVFHGSAHEGVVLTIALYAHHLGTSATQQLERDTARAGKEVEGARFFKIDIRTQHVEEIFFGKISGGTRLERAGHLEMLAFIFSGDDAHQFISLVSSSKGS